MFISDGPQMDIKDTEYTLNQTILYNIKIKLFTITIII